jgi:hypothetical protein
MYTCECCTQVLLRTTTSEANEMEINALSVLQLRFEQILKLIENIHVNEINQFITIQYHRIIICVLLLLMIRSKIFLKLSTFSSRVECIEKLINLFILSNQQRVNSIIWNGRILSYLLDVGKYAFLYEYSEELTMAISILEGRMSVLINAQ